MASPFPNSRAANEWSADGQFPTPFSCSWVTQALQSFEAFKVETSEMKGAFREIQLFPRLPNSIFIVHQNKVFIQHVTKYKLLDNISLNSQRASVMLNYI